MFSYRCFLSPLARKIINLEYKYVTPDRFKDVVTHIRSICAKGDPLNKKFCEVINRGGDEYSEFLLFKTLNEKLSIMAVNKYDKVVGVALNGITKPNDYQDLQYCIDGIKDPQLRHLMQMQLNENLEENIFDEYKIKKFFELRLLSVDSENYSGRIMGKQLVKLSESVASNKNHKIIKSDASGDNAQSILSICGFKCLREKFYNLYFDRKENDPLLLSTVPHQKYQMLLKVLK